MNLFTMFKRNPLLTVSLLGILVSLPVFGQSFPEVPAGLTGVANGSVAWGDFDSDGDLDLLLTGEDVDYSPVTLIYRNDSGSFVESGIYIPGVSYGSGIWGDFDNDADLDILVTGYDASFTASAAIFRNDDGIFRDAGAGLAGVTDGKPLWADLDNDGDLDLVLTGLDAGGAPTLKLYRNDGGTFTEQSSSLPGVAYGSITAADVDRDGDLDLLLNGSDGSNTVITKLFSNDNGTFVEVNTGLPGIYYGSAVLGDYDNDGDLDVLLSGMDPVNNIVTFVYTNEQGTFVPLDEHFTGAYFGSAAWGDYDHDGFLDILITGNDGSKQIAQVFHNEGGQRGFQQITVTIPGVENSMAAWGDFDNDNDLDIVLAGINDQYVQTTRILLNDSETPNLVPQKPFGTAVITNGSSASFQWAPSYDAETPSDGLTYNLRVGITPGGSQVVSPMSDPKTGKELISASGNVGHNDSWNLTNLLDGTYYWGVQSVDNSFQGSTFSDEQSFTVWSVPQVEPVILVANAGEGQVSLLWTPVQNSNFLQYRILMDSHSGPVTQIDSASVINDTTRTITGLTNGVTYYFQVRAFDVQGYAIGLSNEISATPADVTPPAAVQDLSAVASAQTDRQIDLSWTASTEAVNYLVYRSNSSLTDTTGMFVAMTGAPTGYADATPAYATYFYRIFAMDPAGNISGSGNEASAVSPDHLNPEPAAALSATASATDDRRIDLSWTASTSSDVAGYRIYRSMGSSIDTTGNLLASTGTVTYFTDDTPAYGSYSYIVFAVDGSSNVSVASNEASAISPDHIRPDAPTSLAAWPSPKADRGIVLTWSEASTDVAGYEIYRFTEPFSDTTGKFLAKVTMTDHFDITPDYGTWFYLVFAVDFAGNKSDASNEVFADAPDHQNPEPAIALTAVVSTLVEKRVDLSWIPSASADVSQYRIYRSTQSIADTTGLLLAVTGVGTSYADDTLDYGTWYYKVYSVDPSGNVSLESNEASATTVIWGDFDPPVSPLALVATPSATEDLTIDLSWIASTSSDVAGYLVYRSTDTIDDTTGLQIAHVGVQTAYSNTVSAYLRYYYLVFAVDAAGNVSDPSNEASAIAPDHMAPGAPAMLTAVASRATEKVVLLSWAASRDFDVIGYRVYRSLHDGNQPVLAASVGTTTSVTDTVPNFTRYYYEVLAVDPSGNLSDASNEASVLPRAFAPKLSTAFYQNAAASKYVGMVVVSSRGLKESPSLKAGRATASKDTARVQMADINSSNQHFQGLYEFRASGQYTFLTRGVTPSGGDSSQSRSVSVQFASPGASARLSSVNGKAQLQISAGAVNEETCFLSDDQIAAEETNETIYHFGPEKEFNEPMSLELNYDPKLYPDPSKLFIYQNENGQWVPLRSQVYTDRNRIRATVQKLGDFRLMENENYTGSNVVPVAFDLKQNYPNPFNPTTMIAYQIPEDGKLVVTIYNLLGQEVKTLYNGFQYAGSYTMSWDATNSNGQAVSSGVYFYRIQAGRFVQTRKMTLMR